MVRDDVAGVCCGGSGVFAATSGAAWFRRSWGHSDLLPPHAELGGECCRLSFSLPGPVQSVQRAELWGVILALQAAKPVHLGVDNANVVGHVSRIIAGKKPLRPLQILLDGDLLLLIQMLVSARGEGSTSVSKVKGHADEGLVRGGQVRFADKIGYDLADEAADQGRIGVGAHINDVRKDFINVCRTWYQVVRDLHRFFIAISRAVVNDDGKVYCPRSHGLVRWCQAKKAKSNGSGSRSCYGSGAIRFWGYRLF